MRLFRTMHPCLNALLLCVLLGSAPLAEGQAESPGSQPELDDAFDDDGLTAVDTLKLPNSEKYGFRFSISAVRRSLFAVYAHHVAHLRRTQ